VIRERKTKRQKDRNQKIEIIELKSDSGVNFINILHRAFTRVDPKSAKMTVKSLAILRFLGSTRIKASRKHVGEIDPLYRLRRYK